MAGRTSILGLRKPIAIQAQRSRAMNDADCVEEPGIPSACWVPAGASRNIVRISTGGRSASDKRAA